MVDPRIRYDVEATTQGEADVARLVGQLERLDDAIDPRAAASAKELAAALDALGAKQGAINNFLQVSSAANTAGKNLEVAQEALGRLERRLQTVEAPTRAQAGQLQKLRDEATKAQTAFTQNTEALNRARGALDQYGLSANALDGAQDRLTQSIKATSNEARQLVTRYQQTAEAAKSSAAAQTAAQRGVSESVSGIARQLNQLQALAGAALGGSILGQIAGDVSRTADEYNNLAARIRLVTGEGQAFDAAFQGVFDIATRTGTALETTGNLFTRIAQAGKDISLNQRDALAITETITQAVQVSGASAQASDAAITQLIQGLQSGVLRGEEFNSVMEQTPRLAQALAQGLGVTTGELRELAKQGALTSDIVIRALQGQAQTIKREFDQLPPTVGRALQNLQTQWTAYIGQADQASGASALAAKALGLLADNIGTVVGALKLAGESWLAFKALDLAGTLARQALGMQAAAVATGAQTTATVANTAATVANNSANAARSAGLAAATAATAANAQATAAHTAATAANAAAVTASSRAAGGYAQTLGLFGRVAGVVGLAGTAVALFGDAASTAFRTAGTWIGEGIAKLQGYRDRSQEVVDNQAAMAQAAQQAAAQQAALAQELERGRDKAFGLGVEAKRLVGEFEGMQRKGDGATASLEKLAKSLDLGSTKGIAEAGAALDWLAEKGQITGEQLRGALAQGLSGKDLAVFRTNAIAAFNSTEQGARRLGAAMDAVANEAIRRAGTSVEELKTGFSAALNSAINDTDELQRALDRMGIKGEQAGALVAKSLDKELEAAKTERALKAVEDRLKSLGSTGKISGDQMADGLDKARKKADELKAGVDSLPEAYRQLGIKSKGELDKMAADNKAAWDRIKLDATATLQVKQEAFKKYADSAIAANGGVASSTLQAEASMLGLGVQADKTGKAVVKGMDEGKASVQGLRTETGLLRQDLQDTATSMSTLFEKSVADRAASVDKSRIPDTFSELFKNTPNGGITRTATGQLKPPDDSGDWFLNTARQREGQFGLGVWELTPAARARRDAESAAGLDNARTNDPGGFNGTKGYSPFGSNDRAQQRVMPAPAPAPAGKSGAGYTVNVTIGGKNYGIATTNKAAADATIAALEAAYLAGGG